MIEQKKIVIWMRDNWLLSTFLVSLVANILSTVLFAILKATYEVFLVVPWAVPVILGFLLVKQRWNTLKSKYDKIVKLTKLPKTFDRAITVERSPDWGVSTPIIIPTGRHGKYTHLRFDMRVINRTFYPFETEEVAVSCFCYQKGFYKNVHNDSWDKKTHKSETIEVRKDLPVWGQGDGFIMFHVPIKELYDDMEIWRLNGMVKYKSKEPLIDDDNQYANPEIDIEIEYMLPEKQILELKKEVEKALGEEV